VKRFDVASSDPSLSLPPVAGAEPPPPDDPEPKNPRARPPETELGSTNAKSLNIAHGQVSEIRSTTRPIRT
jgi:hypothetical protein